MDDEPRASDKRKGLGLVVVLIIIIVLVILIGYNVFYVARNG